MLMKEALEGGIDMDRSFVRHLDACLGCMGCVTACPSGVRYDELIEATRAQIERHYRRPLADRVFRQAIFAVFPHPGRVRAAAVAGWAYQRSGLSDLVARQADRLPPRVRALDGLLPSVSLTSLLRPLPQRTRAVGPVRRRVGLVAGCVQRGLFAEVNRATVRALAAEGCEVVVPRKQGCCGALMVHAGREAAALQSARALVSAFEEAGVDQVVVNAAGCGSTLKDYGRLLADDPAYAERAAAMAGRTRDVTEVLGGLAPRAPRHPLPFRVAYHDACHLAHAQGVRDEPRRMLATIPGLELVEVGDGDLCCGSAGIHNLVEPQAAEDLGRRKAAAIQDAGVDAVATANPGCILQLRRYLGQDLPLFHPVELVAASIEGKGLRAPTT
jgi:glycolate oxidase iron-sulfur subunit